MPSRQPNLLIIMPDQYRRQAMGFWRDPAFAGHLRGDSDPVHTPNLDALARQSLVLPRASATTPVCSPFRGMFFTGRYPAANGVPHNCGHDRPDCQLRPDLPCLTDILAAAGYDCGYIGKLHLDYPHLFDPARPDWYPGGWDVYTPPERRHSCRYWHSYGTYDVHKNPHYWDADGNRHDPHRFSPDHEAEVAAAYIRNADGARPDDRPFALTVAMNPPHTPNASLDDCTAEDLARYADLTADQLLDRPNVVDRDRHANGARHYFAQVTGVDRALGTILAALDDAGQADNTVVLFLSDHGELLGSHDARGKNHIWQEAFHIPFLLRAPGCAPGVDDALLGAVDYMPTLLGLLGLEERIPEPIDGTDYSPLWTGSRPAPARPHAALFMRNAPGPQDAAGDHRGYTPLARGIVTDRHSLMVEQAADGPALSLYDDRDDPYQLAPLPPAAYGTVIDDLLDQLEAMLDRADDPWAGKGLALAAEAINSQA